MDKLKKETTMGELPQTGKPAAEDGKSSAADAAAPRRKITFKQMAAIAGIALLVLLYLITLVVAIVDSSSAGRLFWICLFATIAVPLLVWIYIWMYEKLKNMRDGQL